MYSDCNYYPSCSNAGDNEEWPAFLDDMSPLDGNTEYAYDNPDNKMPIATMLREINEDNLDEECEEARSFADSESPPSLPSPRKRPTLNACKETCKICDGAATGYHYQVPTCDGCKVFFRRAVRSRRKFKCKNDETCAKRSSSVTEDQGQCRACRFYRCIEAGMDPSAVQANTNPEKREVIKKILAKRTLAVKEQIPSTSKEHPQSVSHFRSEENLIHRIIDGLLYVELKGETFTTSNYNPDYMNPGFDLRKLLAFHSELGTLREGPSDLNLPGKTFVLQDLTSTNCQKKWSFIYAVCAIEYIKTFEFYSKIDELDKLLIAKNIAMCCAQLTVAFYSYSVKRDVIVFPDGTEAIIGQIPLPFKQQELLLRKGMILPLIDLNIDKKEYVLLKAILTCNDAIPGLSPKCQKLLSKERSRYAKLLFDYVMVRRGSSDGPSSFARILAIIDLHFRVMKQRKDIHVLCKIFGPPKVKPPLIEELVADL